MRKLFSYLIISILSISVFGATRLDDEGTKQGYINAIDCVGAGVECTKSGITGTITVSGGGSGDNVTVNGSAVDTTANFKDGNGVAFTLTDGGAGGPDDITATIDHDAISNYVANEHIDWTSDQSASNTIDINNIELPELGTATYDDLKDWLDTTQSAGKISGGAMSDNGDGTISVTAGVGLIKTTDSDVGETKFFDWSANGTLALTNNDTNYIYVEYNAGSPQVATSLTIPSDKNTNVMLGLAYREGTTVHIISAGQYIANYAKNTLWKDIEINGKFQRVSGMIISETGTRNFALTAGSVYAGLVKTDLSAFDSSGADTFTYYYRDGSGGWTQVTSQSQIDNTQYDDGDGTLGTLSNGGFWGQKHYGVHWVYEDIDEHVFVVYGQGDYTLSEAQNVQPPATLPDLLSDISGLVGKIVIQKDASSFESVQSAFDQTFSPAEVANHNDLANIQGGSADEYYHLDNADYTELTEWIDDAVLGSDGALTIPATTTLNGDVILQSDKYVVCSTYTDEGINAAIDALGAEGGEVYLPEGTYTIDGTITIDQNNTTITGSGWGTILDTSGGQAYGNTIYLNGKNNVTIRNLKIVGATGGGQTNDLISDGNVASDYLLVENVWLTDADDVSIYFDSASSDYPLIKNCLITNADGTGAAFDSQFTKVENSTFDGNGYDGLYVGYDKSQVVNCIFVDNYANGLYAGGSGDADSTYVGNIFIANGANGVETNEQHSTFSGNTFVDNDYGLKVSGGDYLSITGNSFYYHGNGYSDIYLNTSHYNSITGNEFASAAGQSERAIYIKGDYNTFSGNTSNTHDTAGVELDATANNNIVVFNNLEGETTSITDNGTNNTIIDTANGDVALVGDMTVEDETYGAGWNGSVEVPTKNAVYDKIESLGDTAPGGSDTQVQYNNGGVFGGDAGLVYDTSLDMLTVKDSVKVDNGTETYTMSVDGDDSDKFKLELSTDTDVNAFYDGVSVGNLDNSANWQEISGLATPEVAANSSYLWTQSDGSVDVLLAIDTTDASNAGEWTLSGINGTDYEDMASGTVGSQAYLYMADIGDNGNSRSTIVIYRIKEPTITGSNGTVSAGDIETITCAYPSGADAPSHKDAETLLVDPDTGDMYIITKRESAPGVYSLAYASSYTGTQTLVYEGDMWDIPDVSSDAATGNAVGGSISPDGMEILVKSYNNVYLFQRPDKNTSIYDTLCLTPTDLPSYVGGGSNTSHPSQEPQGEAVCYSPDSNNYWTASEYVTGSGSTATRFPLFKYVRCAKTPTTVSYQDGVASYTGTEDTYIWDAEPSTSHGSALTFVVDINAGDERRGLLKFDISNVPSGSTIVGAKVDLDIDTEGQGWGFHKVLSFDWDENSTYNNLPGGAGIDADDVEASSSEDCRNGVNLNGYTGQTRNNVTIDTIQEWVDGTQSNYGWLLLATHASDGQQFSSCDNATTADRPKLTLRYMSNTGKTIFEVAPDTLDTTFSGKVVDEANLSVKNGSISSGVLAIYEDSDNGSNFASFQVPALAANTVYTLPADDGDAGEQLQTDGSGVLTWEAAGSGSGAPTDADYLVGTANASLSAEIVVGATPGGELGGTWASPTLDDSVTVTGWAVGASTATTPAADDNDTSIATTAYVQGEINGAGGTGLTCAAGSCSVDLGTSIDISDETNLAAGRSLTMSGDSVEADAELYTTRIGGISFEDPTDADDFKSFAYAPVACTITGIYCETDTGTVNMDIQIDDGTPADVNGTDIACTSSGVLDTSFAGDTTIGAGEKLDLAITSVATSPGYFVVHIYGTKDD